MKIDRRILYPIYLPYLLCLKISDKKVINEIRRDIVVMNKGLEIHKGVLYYLTMHPSFRTLLNYRLGKIGVFFSKLYPTYKLFKICESVKSFGGGACVINHPYGTIINARKIGRNFTCCHLTTIGNKQHWNNEDIPIIGDNVSVGANCTIIGNITIGNNVIIGAGSVVVKDVPDNCIIAGNPAKVIKYIK